MAAQRKGIDRDASLLCQACRIDGGFRVARIRRTATTNGKGRDPIRQKKHEFLRTGSRSTPRAGEPGKFAYRELDRRRKVGCTVGSGFQYFIKGSFYRLEISGERYQEACILLIEAAPLAGLGFDAGGQAVVFDG